VKNFLQDFVTELPEGGYGEPVMFWEGHSFENPLPNTEPEIIEFLKNVNRTIEARGRRIAEALKERLCAVI
jgi:hypothetical protein